MTEWDAFRALDLGRVRKALKAPIVVDLRNIYRPDEMARRGFDYTSVGRRWARGRVRYAPAGTTRSCSVKLLACFLGRIRSKWICTRIRVDRQCRCGST